MNTGRSRDFYLALLILAGAVVVQGTLLSRIRLLGASPNLLVAVIVAWSLVRGVTDGLLWGFAAGLGVDLVAGMPVGASSLALMPTSFLGSLGRSSVYAGNLLLPVIITALATPIHGWILLLIRQLQGVSVDWLEVSLRVILPELLLNAALTLLVYPLLRLVAGKPVRELAG